MRSWSLNLTQPGWLILVAIMSLVTIGIASIYVTDTHYLVGHDGPQNAAKQAIRVLVSLLVAWWVLRVGHQGIGRYAYFFFVAALILLVPLLVARKLDLHGGLFAPRNGAYRWIHLPGFPLQPSELMKVAFVLALAWYLRYRQNFRRFSGLLIPLAVSVLPVGLILLEPDLGTALLLVAVLFTMIYMAGAKLKHLAFLALIGLAAAPLGWSQIKDYQRLRITSVLLQSDSLRKAVIADPDKYALLVKDKRQAVEWAASSGYQLVHSKNAIGSGGVFGYGWGNGVYVQSSLLPDRHNDFVFSLIGHQWGLAGCLLVLACYGVIAMCGVLIAAGTTEPFSRLVAVGVTALLVTQVIVNVGMSLGLMPITGMTLPFVSYGGSSLLTNFIAVALLISVSRHKPFLLALKPFEFGPRRRKTAHLAEPGEIVDRADDAGGSSQAGSAA